MKTSTLAFSCLVLAVPLAGCGTASGRLGDLPPITNQASASTITVVRVSSIVGAANGYRVALDGQDIFGIGSGEHAEFRVPAGEHYIAAKCFGGMTPTWKEDSLKFAAAPGARNYFLITPSGSCAEIKASNEADTKRHLESGKRVDLEKAAAR